MPNEITEIKIKLESDGYYRVYMTKRFAEEYGGGESTICVSGAIHNLHVALNVAKSAITVTKTYRESFEEQNVSSGRPQPVQSKTIECPNCGDMILDESNVHGIVKCAWCRCVFERSSID